MLLVLMPFYDSISNKFLHNVVNGFHTRQPPKIKLMSEPANVQNID